jgi:hypothetical protein
MLQARTPAYPEHISTTVKADFIPKPMQATAVLTTPPVTVSNAGRSSSGSGPQLLSMETFSAGARLSGAENHGAPEEDEDEEGSAEDVETDSDDREDVNIKNGYGGGERSPEPATTAAAAVAALDDLIGHKRNSSGSSGHSAGLGSWNAGSEVSAGSSTERLKAAMAVSGSSRAQLRTSNQNIRAPQGIPGRDAAVAARNPIIPAASATVASEPDMDTNPLRRLRDSQSGFSKAVFRPGGTSSSTSVTVRSDSLLASNNLNANMLFFDKLKEQEQQKMH